MSAENANHLAAFLSVFLFLIVGVSFALAKFGRDSNAD
jgi:hypothetical protein